MVLANLFRGEISLCLLFFFPSWCEALQGEGKKPPTVKLNIYAAMGVTHISNMGSQIRLTAGQIRKIQVYLSQMASYMAMATSCSVSNSFLFELSPLQYHCFLLQPRVTL